MHTDRVIKFMNIGQRIITAGLFIISSSSDNSKTMKGDIRTAIQDLQYLLGDIESDEKEPGK